MPCAAFPAVFGRFRAAVPRLLRSRTVARTPCSCHDSVAAPPSGAAAILLRFFLCALSCATSFAVACPVVSGRSRLSIPQASCSRAVARTPCLCSGSAVMLLPTIVLIVLRSFMCALSCVHSSGHGRRARVTMDRKPCSLGAQAASTVGQGSGSARAASVRPECVRILCLFLA